MTVFQTNNKKYGIKNVVIWVETSTSQIRHGGNYLTLSENKNENSQSIEKHRENKYTCSVSFTQAFLLLWVSEYDGVPWKHRPFHSGRIKRHFFASYT